LKGFLMIKPVRPKDSGSVLVVRQGDEGIEVLMGRRGASAVFGGFWVFPGGKVDRSDRYPRPAHDLTAQILGKLSQDSTRARAFAMAAVRETFEETGLMIAAPGDFEPGPHPSWQAFQDQAMTPRLDRLHYLGHAVTPTQARHRFNARFFVAWAAETHGTLGGSGELVDLAFRPIRACLERPLIDVTRFMLGALLRQQASDFSAPRTFPRFGYRNRQRVVSYH
jgi:8-oxo-dGTP pyrophosphatase MutT (NUDIX family)